MATKRQDRAKPKKPANAGAKNLIPLPLRSKEEQREIRSKGGKASGVVKRQRKTLRKCLLLMASGNVKKGTQQYRGCRDFMELMGMDGDPDGMVLAAASLYKEVLKGSVPAFIAFRDTIGEKPTDYYEDLAPQSPIVLGLVPNKMVDEANRRKAARLEADEDERRRSKGIGA